MKIIILYVLTLPTLFLIDLVWLGVIAKKFYATYLGPIMREPLVWPAIIAFYVIYTVGLLYFAIIPGAKAGSWHLALMNGALFGLFAYMTYDLTNLATLKGFAWQVVGPDIIWGAVLSGLVAVIGFAIAHAIGY
jgi:uncharacterized membrane protein